MTSVRGNNRSVDGFSLGTVNGVPGLIILPDSFVKPSGLGFSGYSEYTTTWTSNVYNGESWIAMEEAGAVFLPAASYYNNATLNTSITIGRYWSSQGYSNFITEHIFFYINSSGNHISKGAIGWKSVSPNTTPYSSSVRLVCEQQSAE